MLVINLVNSLTKTEYLVTFNAFIYSYIMSRFFSGWGRLLCHRKHLIFSIEHILWSIFAFLMLISLWWYSWLGVKTLETRSLTFYTSLLSPFIMYLISSLYFPEIHMTGITNLNRDSRFNRKQSAALYFILYVFLLIREYMDIQSNGNAPYFIIGIIICLIVFFSKKRWLGQLTLVVGFAVIIVYMFNVPSFRDEGNWSFNSFSFSEYIITFMTFIYGFIVAKFLDGWSFFVLKWRTVRLYVEYLLWTGLIFGLIVDFWWGLWNRNVGTSAHFSHLLLTMLIPIGFFIITALLFEDKQSEQSNFNEHFQSNSTLILSMLAAIFIADFSGAWFITGRNLWHVENLFLAVALFICVIAISLKRWQGHRIALVTGWIALIVHSVMSN